jgi:hypothetical protein
MSLLRSLKSFRMEFLQIYHAYGVQNLEGAKLFWGAQPPRLSGSTPSSNPFFRKAAIQSARGLAQFKMFRIPRGFGVRWQGASRDTALKRIGLVTKRRGAMLPAALQDAGRYFNRPGGGCAPQQNDHTLIPSRFSKSRFQSNPPEKPPIFLFAANTRWHGTSTGMGFAPHAPPTARTALGLPMAWAISP